MYDYPTIIETDEDIVSDGDKVCLYVSVPCCVCCCVIGLMLFEQDKGNSSSEKVVLKNTKVFSVLMCDVGVKYVLCCRLMESCGRRCINQ